MSVSVPPIDGSPMRASRLLLPVAGVLLVSLVASVLFNWWAGAALLALGLAVVARPLDPFIATLVLAGAATFVEYGDPRVARDLFLLGLFALYALLCLLASHAGRRWGMPWSQLTAALAMLAVTTALATVHGVAARNSLRFLGLELFPLVGLCSAVAVGGLRPAPSDLRIARWALTAVGLAHAAFGFSVFALTRTRVGGLPFSPIPSFVALLLLNLSLYDPSWRPRFGSLVVICALLLHQLLSFTRGYWLAVIVGIVFSCLLYARRGVGARRRWSKVGTTLGLIALLMILGAASVSLWLGWSEVIPMLGSRFASSLETRDTPETVSNVVRLVELRTSLGLIAAAPWFGYGLGFTLLVRQTFFPATAVQWWVHQAYLMIWLKEGGFGLLALLWALFAALRLGVRGASRPDPAAAGWCAAAAACTVCAATIGLTNYVFFLVTNTFLLALLWGIALAAGEPERRWLVWRTHPNPVPHAARVASPEVRP